MIDSPHGRLSSVVDTDFAQQALDMNLHGRLRYVQFTRDVLVGGTLGQVHQDNVFPVGQSSKETILDDIVRVRGAR